MHKLEVIAKEKGLDLSLNEDPHIDLDENLQNNYQGEEKKFKSKK